MNNENKDFFTNDVENNIDDDIVLAPETELFEEAREIAYNTKSKDVSPFIIHYDANQDDAMKNMIDLLGGTIDSNGDEIGVLTVRVNMAQLAFIKRFDFIRKVSEIQLSRPTILEDEGMSNKSLTDNVVEKMKQQQWSRGYLQIPKLQMLMEILL